MSSRFLTCRAPYQDTPQGGFPHFTPALQPTADSAPERNPIRSGSRPTPDAVCKSHSIPGGLTVSAVLPSVDTRLEMGPDKSYASRR